MYNIDKDTYRSINGYDKRVRFLIMHYTAENFIGSVKTLQGGVSVHYLVPDPTDPTYIQQGFNEFKIFNMVDEQDRAWHAGVSTWGKVNNLNFSSIGIEIVNQASDGKQGITFPPYNSVQIEGVQSLALDIIQRYPEMTPVNIIGHSDIAPYRKSDPGPMFPWKKLYQAGVGAWYDDETKQKYLADGNPINKDKFITKIQQYGYDTSLANNADKFKLLVRAFQMHFRPENYDGVLDKETDAILSALIEKYYTK